MTDLVPCPESECDCYAGHPAEELGFHYHHEPFWNEGTVERAKPHEPQPGDDYEMGTQSDPESADGRAWRMGVPPYDRTGR